MALADDWHGVPKWAWYLGAAVVGFLAFRWYESRQASSTAATTSTATTATATPASANPPSNISQQQLQLQLPGGVSYQGPPWGLSPVLATAPITITEADGSQYSGPASDASILQALMTGTGQGTGQSTSPASSPVNQPVSSIPSNQVTPSPVPSPTAQASPGFGASGYVPQPFQSQVNSGNPQAVAAEQAAYAAQQPTAQQTQMTNQGLMQTMANYAAAHGLSGNALTAYLNQNAQQAGYQNYAALAQAAG